MRVLRPGNVTSTNANRARHDALRNQAVQTGLKPPRLRFASRMHSQRARALAQAREKRVSRGDTDISLSFGSAAPRDRRAAAPPRRRASRDLHPQDRSCCLSWIFRVNSRRASLTPRRAIIERLSGIGG